MINKTKQQQLSISSAILIGLAGGHKRESISGDTSRVNVKATSAQAWFTSSQLQSHLTRAVNELQSALNRMSEASDGDSGRDDRGQWKYAVIFFLRRQILEMKREICNFRASNCAYVPLDN